MHLSAVPEMDVEKQAIFLQILHAHPMINHFITSQQRGNPVAMKKERKRDRQTGNPVAMKRERKRDRETVSWVFPGIIVVVLHKFCKSGKGVTFEKEGIIVVGHSFCK